MRTKSSSLSGSKEFHHRFQKEHSEPQAGLKPRLPVFSLIELLDLPIACKKKIKNSDKYYQDTTSSQL